MLYPTFFVFGLILVMVGAAQFLTRKRQGDYAYHTWKSWGADSMARTPEFWARVSFPITLAFGVVGVGLMIASFVPLGL